MDSPKLERQLERDILRQHDADTTVICPARINAIAGEPFTCRAIAVDGRFSVYVTVTDDAGHYTWIVTE